MRPMNTQQMAVLKEHGRVAAGLEKRRAEVLFSAIGPSIRPRMAGLVGTFDLREEVADDAGNEHDPYVEDIVAHCKGADDAQHEDAGREDDLGTLSTFGEQADACKAADAHEGVGDEHAEEDSVTSTLFVWKSMGPGVRP